MGKSGEPNAFSEGNGRLTTVDVVDGVADYRRDAP